MDLIKIYDLKIFAHHGVYPQETKNGQEFYLDMVLHTETLEAGKTDNLLLSTDYGEVCLFAEDYLTSHTFALLEAAVEHLAEAVLIRFPLVYALELELKKPQAPIPLPFGSVSVKINRGWHKAYVALGSSLGDRSEYITDAINNMKNDKKIRVGKVSDILHTAPYGGAAKEEFLNGAMEIDTLYTPQELLEYLQSLEQKAGRVREVHWGDRTLDLDILLYDQLIIDTQYLTIPHKDMQNRDFVLVPLAQIAPHILHPLLRKTIEVMGEELRDRVWEAQP